MYCSTVLTVHTSYTEAAPEVTLKCRKLPDNLRQWNLFVMEILQQNMCSFAHRSGSIHVKIAHIQYETITDISSIL
jgi:hypothetical protein